MFGASARLRPTANDIVPGRQPEKAFRAEQSWPVVMDKIPKPLRMKRSPGTEDETPDTRTPRSRECGPCLALGSSPPRFELFPYRSGWWPGPLIRGTFPRFSREMIRAEGFSLPQNRIQFGAFLWGHEIDFVNDDHIGELNLVDQQIRDRPFILITDSQVVFRQCLGILELGEKIGRHPPR